MEILTEMRTITEIGNLKDNLSVSIENETIILKLNQDTLFKTLENRRIIVGLINKKLDELVEEHLSTMAKNDEKRNRDL